MVPGIIEPFIPEGVLTLGRSVIDCYNRRNEPTNAPAEQNRYKDLYSYAWNGPTINLLQHILADRLIRSRFYQRQYNAFWNVMIMADAELLYLLLKYGFLNAKVLDEYPEVQYDVTEDKPKAVVMFENWREWKFTQTENLKRMYDPFCHFRFLNSRSHYACVSKRRLRKALWGLETIVMSYSEKSRISKVLCLKTIYQFLREPYITGKEMTDIVKHIGGVYTQNIILENIVRAFEMYFPENGEIYEPRSLQHLCACQIRESMLRSIRYPDGVEQLRLPQIVKNIVLPMLGPRPDPQRIPLYRFWSELPPCFQEIGQEEDENGRVRFRSSQWKNEW